MRVHLTKVSSNKKTGPIPVSTLSRSGCPDTCPLKGNGCYAESGPLRIHWNKVTSGERGTTWDSYCSTIKAFPRGTVHRIAQAGDFPHVDNVIDSNALLSLARANKGKTAIAYTHHDDNPENITTLRQVADLGLNINLSANNLDHADRLMKHGLPVTVVLPSDHTGKVTYTPQGHKVVACPAETTKGITCQRCKLCARQRDYIIGFPAHGTSKKKASIVAQG